MNLTTLEDTRHATPQSITQTSGTIKCNGSLLWCSVKVAGDHIIHLHHHHLCSVQKKKKPHQKETKAIDVHSITAVLKRWMWASQTMTCSFLRGNKRVESETTFAFQSSFNVPKQKSSTRPNTSNCGWSASWCFWTMQDTETPWWRLNQTEMQNKIKRAVKKYVTNAFLTWIGCLRKNTALGKCVLH